MRDSEVVAAIVAGDSGGLAEAYDRYAGPLYTYCRSILSDPADAADAVQDTFVIAAAKLPGLRQPERLRAWLYAVARGEALRITRAGNATSALAQAPDVTGHAADVEGDAERAALRGLLDTATGGLNPGEREVIELQLRQGLEPAEVAAVLGVSRNHAHSLLSRARDQLEVSLGVLLVGRAGQGDCAELRGMLAGWDGRLTVLLRKRLHRHIERCATCATRRTAELRPAMLLGLSPGAAMAAAATESLRAAAGPPAALRAHTLALAAGHDPGAIAHRAAVLGRAGAFGGHGFPKPAPRAAAAPAGRRGKGQLAVGAAVVLAVVAGAVAFSLTGGGGHAQLADGRLGGAPGPGASLSAPAAAAPGTAGPSATRSRAATPSPTPTLAAASATSVPPATPAGPPSPTTAPATASPPPRPTPSPTRAPGTLSVFPAGGPLWIPPWGATIWLSARGGSVTWRTTVSPGPGYVGVSPAGGTLGDGGRVIVTITASQSAAGRQVTVYPGGPVFTIVVAQRHRA